VSTYSKYIKKPLHFIVFLAIGILLLYLSAKKISLDQLIHDLQEANYGWVIVSLACAFLAFVSRAYRWRMLIKSMGYKPTLFSTYNALLIGYTANFAFPRIGEVVRCGTLNRSDNVPLDKLIGTVIIERAIDLISLLSILVILFVLKFKLFGQFFLDRFLYPMASGIWDALTHSFLACVDNIGYSIQIL
jgi:glycosyltransferase 2 family protein